MPFISGGGKAGVDLISGAGGAQWPVDKFVCASSETNEVPRKKINIAMQFFIYSFLSFQLALSCFNFSAVISREAKIKK
jgi:hypothetical protein